MTFGLTEDADYTATDITYNEEACASFTFNAHGQAAGHVSLNVPANTTLQMHWQQSPLQQKPDLIQTPSSADYSLLAVQPDVLSTKENLAASRSSMIMRIIRQRSLPH